MKSDSKKIEDEQAPEVAEREGVSALARGLALLRAVSRERGALGNTELAKVTGIPKATVSRLSATLVAEGFLRQSADSDRFSLGPALLDLSGQYLRHFDLRAVARPHLAALAEAAGASVHLGVRDELDVLVIDTLRPHSALITSRIEVGSRMSMATSAAGRAYLAALPPSQRAPLLEAIRLASGENWAALQPRLMAGLDDYERQGFCASFGEWHPHIHALGFSVAGPRGERYAVSCGGPAYMLPKDVMLGRIGPLVLEAAAKIAAEAGTGGG